MSSKINSFFKFGELNPKFIAKSLFFSCLFWAFLLFISYYASFPVEESSVLKTFQRVVLICNTLIIIIKVFLLRLLSEIVYLITLSAKCNINNNK